jgi:hypothetical protein
MWSVLFGADCSLSFSLRCACHHFDGLLFFLRTLLLFYTVTKFQSPFSLEIFFLNLKQLSFLKVLTKGALHHAVASTLRAAAMT